MTSQQTNKAKLLSFSSRDCREPRQPTKISSAKAQLQEGRRRVILRDGGIKVLACGNMSG